MHIIYVIEVFYGYCSLSSIIPINGALSRRSAPCRMPRKKSSGNGTRFKRAVKKSFHSSRFEIYNYAAVKGKTSRPLCNYMYYIYYCKQELVGSLLIVSLRPALDSALPGDYEFFITILISLKTCKYCENSNRHIDFQNL